jgi:hypothetical protein
MSNCGGQLGVPALCLDATDRLTRLLRTASGQARKTRRCGGESSCHQVGGWRPVHGRQRSVGDAASCYGHGAGGPSDQGTGRGLPARPTLMAEAAIPGPAPKQASAPSPGRWSVRTRLVLGLYDRGVLINESGSVPLKPPNSDKSPRCWNPDTEVEHPWPPDLSTRRLKRFPFRRARSHTAWWRAGAVTPPRCG